MKAQLTNAALAYRALPEQRPALEDVLAAAKTKVRCLCQPGRSCLPARWLRLPAYPPRQLECLLPSDALAAAKCKVPGVPPTPPRLPARQWVVLPALSAPHAQNSNCPVVVVAPPA